MPAWLIQLFAALLRYGLGYLGRDPHDPRDKSFSAVRTVGETPHAINLADKHRFNQGGTSTCTGNAVAELIRLALLHQLDRALKPLSRLFVYYYGRAWSGNQNVDNGAHIRNVVRAAAKHGICDEEPSDAKDKSFWRFTTNNLNKRPSVLAVTEADSRRAPFAYYRITTVGGERLEDIRRALAMGSPVVFGAKIGAELSADRGGIVRKPRSYRGNHAMLIVGYEPDGTLLVQNSWGKGVGREGIHRFDPAYIADASLCWDFWMVDFSVNERLAA